MVHPKSKYTDWVVTNPAEYAGQYVSFVPGDKPGVKHSEVITIQEFNARSLSRRVITVYATVTWEDHDGVKNTTVIPSPQIRGTRFEAGPDCYGRFVKETPPLQAPRSPVEKGLLLDSGLFYARITGNK